MRMALALLLMVALVACGGGDDGDEATATNSPAPATPTAEPSATATTAASPTSSPDADATNQPGGGIGQRATPASAEPTPTRRPVTVVTTPRPIAKTATPSIRFPTSTPTVADDDGITVVIDDMFDDPASTTFFTGESEFGTIASIENGRYNLAVPEQSWQSMVALDAGDLGNAAILVEAGMDGDGAFGVIGRSVTNDDGTWTFYICWLATDGRAGCHASVFGEWVQLFGADAGTVPIYDLNTLFLSVDGDLVTFSVNETVVGSINDGTSVSGNWGVYAESFTGTSVGWFDRVTIAMYDE